MEELIADLMARVLHRPLSRPLSPGAAVKTPRGYGVIVDVINANTRHASWRQGEYVEARIVVDLDDGVRAYFRAVELQVFVEDADDAAR